MLIQQITRHIPVAMLDRGLITMDHL